MAGDGRKKLQMQYNLINLPQTVNQGSVSKARYIWLSDGTKVAVVEDTISNNGYTYLGSMVYSRSGSNHTLESVSFGQGCIVHSTGTYTPYYHTTDHLGSVRVITSPTGTIAEQNDYYPFGMQQRRGGYLQTTTNKYKYNGKEQDKFGDFTTLDYGARFYDPAIARWNTVDPLAHLREWVSPYNFVQNNPIKRIDPNGMLDDWVERDNQVVWDENITSANDADLKPGDKYLGKKGYGVNTKTGASIHYKTDGTTSEGSFVIGEATVTGSMSEHVRTMSNPVVQAIHQSQKDFLNSPVTQATVNTLLFVATGGIEGLTALGGVAFRSIGNIKIPICRVFGGEARAIGNYWSPINPRLYGSQYRNLAGLPNSNTGAFTLRATTPLNNINPSTIKPAASLDGNFGRLVPELKVFDKSRVVVKDF